GGGGAAGRQRLADLLPGDAAQRQMGAALWRSEEHTSELQSRSDLVCRLLLEKKRVSFPKWNSLTPHSRARYLYALARQVQKHSPRLAVLYTIDNGRPIRYTLFPYTTLFRSGGGGAAGRQRLADLLPGDAAQRQMGAALW